MLNSHKRLPVTILDNKTLDLQNHEGVLGSKLLQPQRPNSEFGIENGANAGTHRTGWCCLLERQEITPLSPRPQHNSGVRLRLRPQSWDHGWGKRGGREQEEKSDDSQAAGLGLGMALRADPQSQMKEEERPEEGSCRREV